LSLFECSRKTRIVDQIGALDLVGELVRGLGGSRVLLVTDPGIVAAGHAERAEGALRRSGVAVARFADVRENPTTADVERCVGAGRGVRPDVLLGLGGGSAIDVAKGANFVLCCGGRIQDYRGEATATAPLLPLVAVPTTAGTGTEVQSFALIADETTHQKMACGDPRAAPRIAVLDASLTLSMPRRVTVCTGLDAIGHAVESAVTTRRNESSSAFAHEAFRLAMRSFPRVLDQPDDLGARADMMRAAALAGLAIEHSMLGAAHSMANPLTARVGLPHGQAVGMSLPFVVRFNSQVGPAREVYAALARGAGLCAPHTAAGAAAESLAATLVELLGRAGLPTSLAACGVEHEHCSSLAAEAAQQWTAQFNPRPVDQAAFTRIFTAAVSYDHDHADGRS
jgi:alcohol dehydrogenase